jgi:hypothetical protein
VCVGKDEWIPLIARRETIYPAFILSVQKPLIVMQVRPQQSASNKACFSPVVTEWIGQLTFLVALLSSVDLIKKITGKEKKERKIKCKQFPVRICQHIVTYISTLLTYLLNFYLLFLFVWYMSTCPKGCCTITALKCSLVPLINQCHILGFKDFVFNFSWRKPFIADTV